MVRNPHAAGWIGYRCQGKKRREKGLPRSEAIHDLRWEEGGVFFFLTDFLFPTTKYFIEGRAAKGIPPQREPMYIRKRRRKGNLSLAWTEGKP